MSGTVLLPIALVLMLGSCALIARRRWRESGPENEWENEDFMAREDDGTWAEGSTTPQTLPKGSWTVWRW